jgi:predicted alpha/beta hydrolase
MTSVWFTDDELLTAAAIDAMDSLYTGTRVERTRLNPAEFGLARVGHHGFFRDSSRVLWESVLLPRLAAVELLAAPGEPAPDPVLADVG